MRRKTFITLIITLLLMLCGCGIWRQPGPAPATYLLETSSLPSFSSPSRFSPDLPVATVGIPKAAPGYDTAKIAYLRHSNQLEYFARHRWVDTPARMLWPLLVYALEQSGSFRAVIAGHAAAQTDLMIDSELLRLRQEFNDDTSSVSLILRVQISAPGREVLASRVFSQTEKAITADPVGGVQAVNRILNRMLPAVAAFCAEAGKPGN